MTTENFDGSFTLLDPTTMSFPTLFTPKAVVINGKARGEPKFWAQFIFDAEPFKAIKSHVVAVARAKFGANVDLKTLKYPWQNGNDVADALVAKGKESGEWLRGKAILKTSAQKQPRLTILDDGNLSPADKGFVKDGKLDLETQDQKRRYEARFYAGVKCLAQFNFVAYDGVDGGKSGVTAYLNHVLTINEGKSLAGGKPGSEVFKGYRGAVVGTDPTAGEEEDEIPF